MEGIQPLAGESIPSASAEMEGIQPLAGESIPSGMALFDCLEALARLTHRAGRVLDSRMHSELGLGFAHVRVLRWIERETMTSAVLARRGGYSLRNVLVKIAWLIEAGLVERVSGPGRRRVVFRATEHGRAVCAKADVLIVDQTDVTLRALSEEKGIPLSQLAAWSTPSGRP